MDDVAAAPVVDEADAPGVPLDAGLGGAVLQPESNRPDNTSEKRCLAHFMVPDCRRCSRGTGPLR